MKLSVLLGQESPRRLRSASRPPPPHLRRPRAESSQAAAPPRAPCSSPPWCPGSRCPRRAGGSGSCCALGPRRPPRPALRSAGSECAAAGFGERSRPGAPRHGTCRGGVGAEFRWASAHAAGPRVGLAARRAGTRLPPSGPGGGGGSGGGEGGAEATDAAVSLSAASSASPRARSRAGPEPQRVRALTCSL